MTGGFYKAVYEFRDRSPLLRAYLCNYGIDVFGSNSVGNAQEHMLQVFTDRHGVFSKSSGLIGILWGDDNSRMIDLFGFVGEDENPEVRCWLFRDGGHVSTRTQAISCSNGILTLAKEIELRQRLGAEAYAKSESPLYDKSGGFFDPEVRATVYNRDPVDDGKVLVMPNTLVRP